MGALYLKYIAHGEAETPAQKFILAKILGLAGDDEWVIGPDRALAIRVGVSDKTLSHSLKAWVKSGVLEKEKVIEGKGCPRPKYWIKPQKLPLKKRSKAASIMSPLSPFVDNLMGLDKGSKFGGGVHNLGYGARVLLMVLFAHADNFGVVKGLGFSDLAYLSGLSSEGGVITQLERLKRSGYIRSYVSGLTSSKLFGKTKSVYFLNLNHRGFGELRVQGLITIYQAFEPGRDLQEAARLLDAVKQIKEGLDGIGIFSPSGRMPQSHQVSNDWHKVYDEFHDFFSDKNVESYLQLKLEEYASYILSQNWNKPHLMIDNSALRDLMRHDLVLDKDKKWLKSEKRSKEQLFNEYQINSMLSFIEITSFRIADSITRLVPKDGTNYSHMNHILLPLLGNREKRAAFTLLSFTKPKYKEVPTCIRIIKISEEGEHQSLAIKTEDKLDEFDLLEYGLIAKPNDKVKTWKRSKLYKKLNNAKSSTP